MSANLLQAEQALSQLPKCAQQVAAQGINASGCGFDIPCICTSEKFLTLLQDSLAQVCDAESQDVCPKATLSAARELCLGAVPSLNGSKQPEVYGALIFMIILVTVAVIMRMASRRISATRYGWDDVLIIFALICTYGLNATSFVGLHYGYGLHMIRLNYSEITSFAKSDFATQILFALSITFTKLSLLFFYHRIFPVKTFTRISIATGIFMILWCLALILTIIFSCLPVPYFWDKTIKNGHCVNENDFSYGISAANVLTDVIVLVLPIPWLWKLQMKTGRKVAIGIIFMLGSFVCVAGIVRIPLLAQVKTYDITYTIVRAGIWINVEANIGIVSACLPVLRPLFSLAPSLPKSFTSRFSNTFSWRSSKLTGSRNTRSKTESANSKTPAYAPHQNRTAGEGRVAPHNTLRASSPQMSSYQMHWPQRSAGSTTSDSTRVEPHGSPKQDKYEVGGGMDDLDREWADLKQREQQLLQLQMDRNRSLWVDEHGRGQTMYSSLEAYAPAHTRGDEEMGHVEIGRW